MPKKKANKSNTIRTITTNFFGRLVNIEIDLSKLPQEDIALPIEEE